MDKERIKLIISNMELLIDSLKKEVLLEDVVEEQQFSSSVFDDYDEVFEEYDD